MFIDSRSHALGTALGAEQAHIHARPPGAALCQECEALILVHTRWCGGEGQGAMATQPPQEANRIVGLLPVFVINCCVTNHPETWQLRHHT